MIGDQVIMIDFNTSWPPPPPFPLSLCPFSTSTIIIPIPLLRRSPRVIHNQIKTVTCTDDYILYTRFIGNAKKNRVIKIGENPTPDHDNISGAFHPSTTFQSSKYWFRFRYNGRLVDGEIRQRPWCEKESSNNISESVLRSGLHLGPAWKPWLSRHSDHCSLNTTKTFWMIW